MEGREFVDHLWKKYYDVYEGPIRVIRDGWADFPAGSAKLNQVLSEQAIVELMGGEAQLSGVVRFPDIEYHLRTKIARHGFDELRHYEILRDYLRQMNSEVDADAAQHFRSYYSIQTARDKTYFLLGNFGEKSADNFFKDLYEKTTDAHLKEMCRDINIDEGFHMELLDEKMMLFAGHEAGREMLERTFDEVWKSVFASILQTSLKFGVDAAKLLEENGLRVPVGVNFPKLAVS